MTEQGYPEPQFGDELEAREAREQEAAARREIARRRFRSRFPVCAAFADDVRTAFGDGVEIVYAIEDGGYVGALPEERKARHEATFGPLQRVRL